MGGAAIVNYSYVICCELSSGVVNQGLRVEQLWCVSLLFACSKNLDYPLPGRILSARFFEYIVLQQRQDGYAHAE